VLITTFYKVIVYGEFILVDGKKPVGPDFVEVEAGEVISSANYNPTCEYTLTFFLKKLYR